MKKIAVLGPENTFTDLASQKYMEISNSTLERVYYPSITKTFEAVNQECFLGVIPIENKIDGYVQVSLDLLAQGDLKIINEIELPIEFIFISKKKNSDAIKNVYTQFKSYNQCIDFIENLGEKEIVTTASNAITYNEFLNNDHCDSAIIPRHILNEMAQYEYVVYNVANYKNNYTRFAIIGRDMKASPKAKSVEWRSSFVILNDNDRPGLLIEILQHFSKKNINLKSIISRPRKDDSGNYNFFIDIQGSLQNNEEVQEVVNTVSQQYTIKPLGSYFIM